MFKNTAWTLIGYGTSLSLRLVLNIILARLLAPELLGVMLIVNSIRYGVELLTDLGIEQNIVKNRKGLDPIFFNTAWTMQIIRGLVLTLLFLLASAPISNFYKIDHNILFVISLCPFVNSLASTSIFALVKNLRVRERNLFELQCEFGGFLLTLCLALATRSIWALVIGTVLTIALRSLMSYLLPHPPHKMTLDREHAFEIVRFGKWIAASSLLMYAGTNFDKIYLGKVLPLEVVGVYGLARIIADMPTALAVRLTYQIVLPTASLDGQSDERAAAQLSRTRYRLLAIAAMCVGFGVATADIAVSILYDARYFEAGWILSFLLLGSWLSVISNIGEGFMLAANKPSYPGIAHVGRLATLAVALPFGAAYLGVVGALWALLIADLVRYSLTTTLQTIAGYRFLLQDIGLMLILASTIVLVCSVRLGAGSPPPWPFLSVFHF